MGRMRCCLLCLCLLLSLPVLAYAFLFIILVICDHAALSAIQPVVHFVAPDASTQGPLASHPLGKFWKGKLLEGGGLWNRLQLLLDQQYSPLLNGKRGNPSSTSSPSCHNNRLLNHFLQDYNGFPDQIEQFVRSMHCREYPQLLDQPRLCGPKGHSGPTLLIAIKSQECNYQNRQAIRETWGRAGFVAGHWGPGGEVRTVFLLGMRDPSGPHCPDATESLEVESRRHGDILQWDFRDTFFNLSLKDVLLWSWMSQRCPRAQFILKGDDDVVVRTPALLDYLHQGRGGDDAEFCVGDVIRKAEPIRRNSSKYWIPESFFQGVYPPYAGGGGVLYSGALAHRLNGVSRRVHLFPIDDVFLGMCLRRLGLAPTHHTGFFTFDFSIWQRKNPCAYYTILLVHKRSPAEMIELWPKLQTIPPSCQNQSVPRRPLAPDEKTQGRNFSISENIV